jgi:hypothetical protein
MNLDPPVDTIMAMMPTALYQEKGGIKLKIAKRID